LQTNTNTRGKPDELSQSPLRIRSRYHLPSHLDLFDLGSVGELLLALS
jgi:hypothetical protein